MTLLLLSSSMQKGHVLLRNQRRIKRHIPPIINNCNANFATFTASSFRSFLAGGSCSSRSQHEKNIFAGSSGTDEHGRVSFGSVGVSRRITNKGNSVIISPCQSLPRNFSSSSSSSSGDPSENDPPTTSKTSEELSSNSATSSSSSSTPTMEIMARRIKYSRQRRLLAHTRSLLAMTPNNLLLLDRDSLDGEYEDEATDENDGHADMQGSLVDLLKESFDESFSNDLGNDFENSFKDSLLHDPPDASSSINAPSNASSNTSSNNAPPTYEMGCLPPMKLHQISFTIDQWIATGEHRYLGAKYAVLLIKLLIIESGWRHEQSGHHDTNANGHEDNVSHKHSFEEGTTSFHANEFRRRNQDVDLSMFNLDTVIRYLNSLYKGQEFVDRVLDIVNTFENEYDYPEDATYASATTVTPATHPYNSTNYNNTHSLDETASIYQEIPYKYIISSLCKCESASAAVAAQQILDRYEWSLARSSPTSAFFAMHEHNLPTVETYNSILSCWMNSLHDTVLYFHNPRVFTTTTINNNAASFVDKAEIDATGEIGWHSRHLPSTILATMLALYRADPESMLRVKPDFLTFNMVVSSLSKLQQYHRQFDSRQQQQQQQRRQRRQQQQQWQHSPSFEHNHNINDSDDDDSERMIGMQCFQILKNMMHLYHQGHDDCAPDMVTFSMVLTALGKGEHNGDLDRAIQVWEFMLRFTNEVDLETEHFGVFDDFFLKDNKRDITTDVTSLLSPISSSPDAAQSYIFDVTPRKNHLDALLGLISNTHPVTNKTFHLAKGLIQMMEHIAQQRKKQQPIYPNPPPRHSKYLAELSEFHDDADASLSSSIFKPDTISYNKLIGIAAKMGKPQLAEDVLDEMMKKYSNGDYDVKPDSFSFNTVISAWSKSKHSSAGAKVAAIFHQMQEMADQGDEDVQPDRVSLTSAIIALSNAAKHNRNCPNQAERIIERMEASTEPHLKPDAVTYTSLIKCWSQSGRPQTADRAEEIIELLHQRYLDGHKECKPDNMAYNVALYAIAKSKAPNSGERAEALLQRMQERHYDGDDDLAPTTESFATVMLAWALSNDPNGPLRAESILNMMLELHESGNGHAIPNAVAYSTCIDAWSKSKKPNAGKRAHSLLQKMEEYYKQGIRDARPNAIVYTSVMNAWTGSGDPNALERVEELLDRMMKQYKAGNPDLAPTTTTFNVALKAIRHSSEPLKHLKAESLFNRMKKMAKSGNHRSKLDTRSYNGFITACAYTKGSPEEKRAAFLMAINALAELQNDRRLRPDSYTWPAVWKACENLLDLNKDMGWINRVFDLCSKSGDINNLLFNNIRSFLPPKYLQKKLKTTEDVSKWTAHDLPKEWTRNARLGRFRSGKRENQKMVS